MWKKEGMIELTWNNPLDGEYDVLYYATSFLTWLTSIIVEKEEYHDIVLGGYMTINENTQPTPTGCSTLLMCRDIKSQKKIMEIIQNPPGEFKGKYVASTPCAEPDLVKVSASQENLIVDPPQKAEDASAPDPEEDKNPPE